LIQVNDSLGELRGDTLALPFLHLRARLFFLLAELLQFVSSQASAGAQVTAPAMQI